MTNKQFSVTYEIITPESCEHGEAEEQGYSAQNIDLREALELVSGGVDFHADCYPCHDVRWVTAYNVHEGTHKGYTSDSTENRSIHFPKHLTESTRFRIMRLMGVYGSDSRLN